MNASLSQPLSAALMLGVFSLIGIGLVTLVFYITGPKVSQNQHDELLRSLKVIMPADLYDNDLVSDTLHVSDSRLGGAEPVAIYRARKNAQPVAAVIASSAPDGYNGTIKLLVAIMEDGRLAGVRVVAHKETPGLGDRIEVQRSNWILTFTGKSLTQPDEKLWAVKRDGGVFDQFTGATITPRAVVKAVKNALLYFQQHKQVIFSQRTD